MHDTDEFIDALDLQNDLDYLENWTIEKAMHMYRNTIRLIILPRSSYPCHSQGFFNTQKPCPIL